MSIIQEGVQKEALASNLPGLSPSLVSNIHEVNIGSNAILRNHESHLTKHQLGVRSISVSIKAI